MSVMRDLGIALLLVLATTAARAEMVRNLYSAQVPVADQSAAKLAAASKEALAVVLVKVSGSSALLRNPVIAAALPKARSHVQQYSYSKDALKPGGLLVQVLFDKAYISGLVIEAGAPLWTANRPAVLVWLVMDGVDGPQFVNEDTAPEAMTALRREFSRRGLPLQLPLYDAQDTAALSPQQAVSQSSTALENASARYQLADVLVGTFSVDEEEQVGGNWRYFYDGKRQQRSAKAKSGILYMREGAGLAAEAMAARYAVSASAEGIGVAMSVTGVTDYADYAAIVAWLESLELIELANVETVQGDTITLRLQAQADPAQLATIIEINEKLVPVPVTGPGPELKYLWQK